MTHLSINLKLSTWPDTMRNAMRNANYGFWTEDTTCPCVDGNFIFAQYLTSERSKQVRYRVELKAIKFISRWGHVMFCLLHKHQWKRCNLLYNHNNGDLFTCEDNIKIWSFHATAYWLFHWCLYNKRILCSCGNNDISWVSTVNECDIVLATQT